MRNALVIKIAFRVSPFLINYNWVTFSIQIYLFGYPYLGLPFHVPIFMPYEHFYWFHTAVDFQISRDQLSVDHLKITFILHRLVISNFLLVGLIFLVVGQQTLTFQRKKPTRLKLTPQGWKHSLLLMFHEITLQNRKLSLDLLAKCPKA